MITLRYKKEDSAIFVSHIDLLKQFIKIINRSKINVEYSKGFHPHMQLYFTTPLPVGVSSDSEYVTIYTEEKTIIDRLNEKSIGGIVFTKEYVSNENPKLTKNIDKASYVVKVNLTDLEVAKVNEFLSRPSIVLQVMRKGELAETDVKPLIYDYKVSNQSFECTLACGNPNLRIDYLIKKINEELSTDIHITNSRKISQFISETGENVEDYLERIKWRNYL